ncbi:DUF2752 domain-containing protein [Salinibacter ruber]|uniref:DUF2752 domain-containing protein n=1 Tax=Salinibacter ruber TaxID=146919 RepID=A0A9X2UN55_9BACT|nr:DUF2752 domain-containing protein [Salinibacter ruber]MCS3615959.1 hypothetical protein [Salinibacter ruber]MCS4037143.1 hypothetical protein [Salinibacter ruber]
MPTVQGAVGPVVRRLRAVPFEAVFWTAALLAAASIAPQSSGGTNLCLIEQLGLPCPGDGLGTAIAHLARGHWTASWNAHPLAGPVVGVLAVHVVSLCRTAPAPSH